MALGAVLTELAEAESAVKAYDVVEQDVEQMLINPVTGQDCRVRFPGNEAELIELSEPTLIG